MGTINGLFIYNGAPQNGATAKLWKITAFAAYANSGETVQDTPLAAASVELNCSDGGVFAVGEVIKMEDECCLIWKISTDLLYIIRGWHQTAPAQHIATTEIYDETITPPVRDDAEPGSGQYGGDITTAVAYGGDGAYRFDDVPEMEYYASVFFATHRSFIHHFVERNDPTLLQVLLADGDIAIRDGDTVTRLPKGPLGHFLKMGANRPEWSAFTAGSLLTVAETEVYSANAPTAWTDLSLAGVVGANAALVVLKVYHAGTKTYAFRKNGDADEFYSVGYAKPAGCVLVETITGVHFVVVVATDNSGIIEWIGQTAVATTIDVIAFIAQ